MRMKMLEHNDQNLILEKNVYVYISKQPEEIKKLTLKQ